MTKSHRVGLVSSRARRVFDGPLSSYEGARSLWLESTHNGVFKRAAKGSELDSSIKEIELLNPSASNTQRERPTAKDTPGAWSISSEGNSHRACACRWNRRIDSAGWRRVCFSCIGLGMDSSSSSALV